MIDARQAHAVLRLQHNKTDVNDAAVLAGLAHTGFCREIHVKSDEASRMRVLLKARDCGTEIQSSFSSSASLASETASNPLGSFVSLGHYREASQLTELAKTS